MSANFDNIADEQALSPTLLESYLNAAADISRMAVGDRNARGRSITPTRTPSYVSQHPWDHVEGAPYGTRGGMVVDHVFPADGEYVFEVTLNGGDNARYEDIDISIDGERVALLATRTLPAGGADGRGANGIMTEPVLVKAGQHRSRRRSCAGRGSLRRPDSSARLVVRGRRLGRRRHHHAAAPARSDHSRSVQDDRRVADAEPAEGLHLPADLARRRAAVRARDRHAAGRRGLSSSGAAARDRPADAVLPEGRGKAADSRAASAALEAILSSPHFIFRLEREPETARPARRYRVADLDLASRLSFFLWGTPPDKELVTLPRQGKLSATGVLERQTRRLLADPRAEALGSRFAAQWLRLQDIDKVKPDPNFYPELRRQPRRDDAHETELFFNNLVREDRSLLDLYRADYTFMNERLARHYGIPASAGASSAGSVSRMTRGAACSARAACSCRPRSPTAPRRCCAASG